MTATTSRLLRTIADFRQRLLDREAQAANAMDRYHAHTIASYITPRLNKLYDAIQQKYDELQSEDGTAPTIPPSWIYEQIRLQGLKDLLQGKIDQFGALALQQTRLLQTFGLNLGIDSAVQQLGIVVPASIKGTFGVPSQRAIESLVGATQKGSPLTDLFNGFGAEAADKVSKALVTGVTAGLNPRVIAKGVQDVLGISRARALTISRTESLRAYRGGALETYRQNSDVTEGWVWSAALNSRSCAACIAMNGTKHPLSEEFGSHPNCRCAPVPLTKSLDSILSDLGIDSSGITDTRVDLQSGEDWFSNQSEDVQRSILGNAGYDLWRNNDDVDLHSFLGKSSDPDWGDSIYQRSVKQVLARR